MNKQAAPSFLKHAAVYALGDLLVMAGGIVLLPLYTRRLGLDEFGSLELLERLGEIAGICLLTRGIPLATFAHYKQSLDENGRRRVLGAGLLLALAATVAGAGAVALAAPALSDGLRVGSATLVWIAVTASLLDSFSVVAQAVAQARQESARYVAIAFGQFLTKVALCILFVAVFRWGAWGVLLASLLRAVVFAALLAAGECRRGLLRPDRATLKSMLVFLFPFLPTGLCFFVLNSGDRFFLVRDGGPEEVGVYGIGYRLATLVGVFSINPLYRVWSARLYDVAVTADAAEVFGHMTTRLLGGYVFAGLALCLFAPEVVSLFAGPRFAAAALLVPPIVLAYWFQGLSTLAEAGLYVRRRTGLKFWIALASTATMLSLYASLIPARGALGAALATLLGFAFHAALTCVVAQRVFPVRYETGRLGAMLLLAVGLWCVSCFVGVGLIAMPLKLGLWLLWPGLLFLAGFFSTSERQWARTQGRALAHAVPNALSRFPVRFRVLGFVRRSPFSSARSRVEP